MSQKKKQKKGRSHGRSRRRPFQHNAQEARAADEVNVDELEARAPVASGVLRLGLNADVLGPVRLAGGEGGGRTDVRHSDSRPLACDFPPKKNPLGRPSSHLHLHAALPGGRKVVHALSQKAAVVVHVGHDNRVGLEKGNARAKPVRRDRATRRLGSHAGSASAEASGRTSCGDSWLSVPT